MKYEVRIILYLFAANGFSNKFTRKKVLYKSLESSRMIFENITTMRELVICSLIITCIYEYSIFFFFFFYNSTVSSFYRSVHKYIVYPLIIHVERFHSFFFMIFNMLIF